ncbi:hypothetical protein GPECTOR_28g755 [Gonium pectorale]|uniref:ASCH domain-containing protein n=1 Tax=Gonium pectorale TaxID=33097 RepID=A0A150GEV3_GONPE|nr:hypothetical protein GPECTOR_28g755 [Gonium pectorale]|eukprot:KXZ48348.1 hypothetical protein GPECTOR_28g755 [Gonium pectorale]
MPRYLELIRSGAKTVEGRIRVGKWADVVPGDLFRFFSNEQPPPPAGPAAANPPPTVEPALCVATSVRQYDSFRAMLEGEGLQACLPGCGGVEEGVEVYRGIPGYREREGSDGVVAVGVRVLAGEEARGALEAVQRVG